MVQNVSSGWVHIYQARTDKQRIAPCRFRTAIFEDLVNVEARWIKVEEGNSPFFKAKVPPQNVQEFSRWDCWITPGLRMVSQEVDTAFYAHHNDNDISPIIGDEVLRTVDVPVF